MSLTFNSEVVNAPTEHGLGAAEAAERLRRDGRNELPQERARGTLRIVLDAVREPMLQLLLAAGIIYLAIGDLAEALILLAFAVLNVILVVVQESRTEHALAALKDMTSPKALVVRDGLRQRIPGGDVVVGDLIVVSEGDRVPADARLLAGTDLEADESLLTGESVPVRKSASPVTTDDARPGGDDTPDVWSGSLIVRGTGLAQVTATGARTEIGRIGKSLASVESAPTPLQIQTRRLVRVFAVLGIGSSIFLTVAYGLLHGGWLAGILAGITLAMATLPEEFPLVLTVFLVLGAWRMSRNNVLTRRSAAIEALGAVTVLCTDKTGTLTMNRMTVAALVADGERLVVAPAGQAELPEQFHPLVEFAILASRPDPFDPMERAFSDLGERFLRHTEHLHADWSLEHGYPLQSDLLAMSQVWRAKAGSEYVIAAKGAPEAIADLCHMSVAGLEGIRRDVAMLAAEGLRVLAVAKGVFAGPGWPEKQHDFEFSFVGLLGLADPLRPEVPEAVAACTGAGVRIVMITGDHPATARAIARQAGISAEGVLTGQEMASLDDAGFRDRLARTNVFARIMPEQKLRLVQAFAASGEVVAMTGDGVNDAPSLKAAHIGVAMGGRGTDVAREAASLVLLDDNFASLVTAVRLGRRIDDNLRKAIGYILAVHVPIAGMSLIPVLFGWPLVLGPIHVVFLELVIDPVSSIVFEAEPEEKDVMRRPPRKPDAPLFDAALLARGLIQGAIVLLAALGVFRFGIWGAHSEAAARCMAFVTLVIGNLGLVLTNRSLTSSAARVLMRPNPALALVIMATLLALGLSVSVPWLRGLFGFEPLDVTQFIEALSAAFGSIVVNDVGGTIWRQVSKGAASLHPRATKASVVSK
jgi:Ca2+-transporting ATPase